MAALSAVHVESGRLDPDLSKESAMTISPKRLARTASVLYLLVIGVRPVKPRKPDELIAAVP
jgi:hypothetical protein